MHFNESQTHALMKVYTDICSNIQFEDKIHIASDLVLLVDDVKEYRYSLDQVLYHSDRDAWQIDRHNVSVQTDPLDVDQPVLQNEKGTVSSIIIKVEKDTEVNVDNNMEDDTHTEQSEQNEANLVNIMSTACINTQTKSNSSKAKQLENSAPEIVSNSNRKRVKVKNDDSADSGEKSDMVPMDDYYNNDDIADLHFDQDEYVKTVNTDKTTLKPYKKYLIKDKGDSDVANHDLSVEETSKTVQIDKISLNHVSDDLLDMEEDSDTTIIEDFDDNVADPDFDAEENVKTMKIDESLKPDNQQTSCSKCGKQFRTKKYLRRHVAMMHSDKVMCDYCGNSYKQDTLKRHIQAIHKGVKRYKCTIEGCEESFNFNHSLKLHLFCHTGERPHACPHCSKSYLTVPHLRVHIQTSHNKDKSYRCRYCGEAFLHQTTCKYHEERHNGLAKLKKNRQLQCELCDTRFSSSQALKYHIMAKHTTGGHHTCEVCHKAYKTEMLLKTHQRQHAQTDNSLMCDICGRLCMSKSALEIHKSAHEDAKKFYCKTCGKYYKSYATIRAHQLLHGDSKVFSCSICNKTCTTKASLKNHEKRHSGLKPFSCTECNNCFSDKRSLQRHLETVHVAVKKFVCQICGKETARADNLRVHMKVHAKPGYKTQ